MKLSERLHQIHVSGDVGNYLDGFAEQAEALENAKPKIKMTKELPSENSMYLWASDSFGEMFSTYVFMYPNGPKVAHNGDLVYCKDIGGYWAKVDKSMFEFED